MRALSVNEIKSVSGGVQADVVCTGFFTYVFLGFICCNAGQGPVCNSY